MVHLDIVVVCMIIYKAVVKFWDRLDLPYTRVIRTRWTKLKICLVTLCFFACYNWYSIARFQTVRDWYESLNIAPINTTCCHLSGSHTFLCISFGFWLAVSRSILNWFTPDLRRLLSLICSFRICESCVDWSNIQGLVLSPKRTSKNGGPIV